MWANFSGLFKWAKSKYASTFGASLLVSKELQARILENVDAYGFKSGREYYIRTAAVYDAVVRACKKYPGVDSFRVAYDDGTTEELSVDFGDQLPTDFSEAGSSDKSVSYDYRISISGKIVRRIYQIMDHDESSSVRDFFIQALILMDRILDKHSSPRTVSSLQILCRFELVSEIDLSEMIREND